jgi:hypothetical protein
MRLSKESSCTNHFYRHLRRVPKYQTLKDNMRFFNLLRRHFHIALPNCFSSKAAHVIKMVLRRKKAYRYSAGSSSVTASS